MPLLCCLPRRPSHPTTPGTRKKEYHSLRKVPLKDRYNTYAPELRSQSSRLDSHQLYPGDRRYQTTKYNTYTGYTTADDFRTDGINSYSEDSFSSFDDSYRTPYRQINKREKAGFNRHCGRPGNDRMRQFQNSSNFSRTDNSYSDPSTRSTYSDECSSALSMNIITVTLNLSEVSYLGMSIVGQCYSNGDNGIYVGAILKGGAVDRDGRVEPGDMILAVNDTSVENMTNEAAVNLLRTAVQQASAVTLVVAKCWEDEEDIVESDDRLKDPVRPIDPSLWVAHTNAMTRRNSLKSRSSRRHHGSLATLSSLTSSSLSSSCMESETGSPGAQLYRGKPLTIETPPNIIIDFMMMNDSGLELREKEWLKIRLPASCLGADLIDWLLNHVHGFIDRRDAKKYARALLKASYLRAALKENQKSFNEEEYYTFPQLLQDAMSSMGISDDNTDSEAYFPSKSEPLKKAVTNFRTTQPIIHQPPAGNSQQPFTNNLQKPAGSQPPSDKPNSTQLPPPFMRQTSVEQKQKESSDVFKTPASRSSSSSGVSSQKTNNTKSQSSRADNSQSIALAVNSRDRSKLSNKNSPESQNPGIVANPRSSGNTATLPPQTAIRNTCHPQTTARPPFVPARDMNRYSQSVTALNHNINQASIVIPNQHPFTASQPNLLNAPAFLSSQNRNEYTQSSSRVSNVPSINSLQSSTVPPQNRSNQLPPQYQRQTKHSDV